MSAPIHKTTFDEFFEQRNTLIYLYQKGDISKREFIQEHYDYIMRLHLKPFQRIDSFEKGIYNYQYFNALAKYGQMQLRDKKLQEKHPELIHQIEEKTRDNYRRKDEAILRLLRYLDYQEIEAYFIKAKSEYLDHRLIEIVLLDYEDTILHTVSQRVLEGLREEGVFQEVRRRSRIDRYVNQKY